MLSIDVLVLKLVKIISLEEGFMFRIALRVQVFAGFAGIVAAGLAPAAAGEQRASDIARALAPTVTRSLSSGPSTATPEQTDDEAFVNSVRDRGARSLSGGEVDHLDKIISQRKDVDVEMTFAYGSATLKGKDLEIAEDLGKALSRRELKDQTFLIMGHTDAKGSNAFNQKLSERRAAELKDFLVKKYNLQANRLVPVGYGETHLKNAEYPNAAENRRVQVVNIMAYKSANK